jgi:integrase
VPAPNRPRTPSYRHHKPSHQAVVTIDGRDIYLGRYDSPESRAEYDRVIAEWLASGRRLPGPGSDLTVNEVLREYMQHVDGYYIKDGRPTSEPKNIRLSIRPARQLYGDTLAREFGPLKLKAVRQAMIEGGLCRDEINKRVRRIVRAFKWAVAEEMVPPSVHQGLKAVAGLRRGRTEARESEPVKPVADALVDAIRPHVSRQVWAMVELQRLTGMRPGEVSIMRTIDLDMAGRIWIYTPTSHKTQHHGKDRRIHIGPRAQAILKPWLRPELAAYLFQPREAEAERKARLREARKTRVQPSQMDRSRPRPERAPGERYDTDSYRQAIARACDRAFPHPVLAELSRKDLGAARRAELEAWCEIHRGEIDAWRQAHRWYPHQLRHTAATAIRRQFGLDAARACLGHSSPVVTEVYAELDEVKAADVMGKIG